MAIDYGQHIQSNLFLLYVGIGFVFIGLSYFQITDKNKLSLVFIALGSFCIGMFLNFSDPFLHHWDEQFHAVVAKNMLENPFKPMLLTEPILPYDFKNWTRNHIWLHKQPWFLWQIALSFKIFGTTIVSLRLPSIVMTSLLVFPIYRMGKIISGKQAGIYAAVLFAGSNFIYQLGGGRIATDHNDIAFLFYVTLSIWAWFEKENSHNKYWIVFIGVFAGIAILNKWLVGLVVYAAWGLNLTMFKENRSKIQLYGELVISFVVTLIVVLPWQLYILYKFPNESLHEYKLNSLHFCETIEGHSGDFLYHLKQLERLYGTDFQYLILTALIVFSFSSVRRQYKLAVVALIVIVYTFYSFAATKLPAFTVIVAPLIYIIVAHTLRVVLLWLEELSKRIKAKRIFIQIAGIVLVFFVFFHFLNHNGLSLTNNDQLRKDYQFELTASLTYDEILSRFGDNELIVFNAPLFDMCKFLFTSNAHANIGIPDQNDIDMLKNKALTIVIFDNDKLPAYIINDSSIAKVRSGVWQKEMKTDLEVYY